MLVWLQKRQCLSCARCRQNDVAKGLDNGLRESANGRFVLHHQNRCWLGVFWFQRLPLGFFQRHTWGKRKVPILTVILQLRFASVALMQRKLRFRKQRPTTNYGSVRAHPWRFLQY